MVHNFYTRHEKLSFACVMRSKVGFFSSYLHVKRELILLIPLRSRRCDFYRQPTASDTMYLKIKLRKEKMTVLHAKLGV